MTDESVEEGGEQEVGPHGGRHGGTAGDGVRVQEVGQEQHPR